MSRLRGNGRNHAVEAIEALFTAAFVLKRNRFMAPLRAPLLVAIVVLSLCVVPLSAAGVAGSPATATAAESTAVTSIADPHSIDDHEDDPTTSETIGYVEGYWYDDELPVDDRDDGVVADDELDAVVYRSMARVEELRELPFEDEVSVEVITRSEFQDQQGDLIAERDGTRAIEENVHHEALFITDRETSAIEETEALFGDAVGGFYDPLSNEIVLVADDEDAPELDEPILGHELLHALQDQHFDLTSFDRETLDGATADNGLVEGDAVAVEREYGERCDSEWDCVLPTGQEPLPDDINLGLYFIQIHPYDEGPEYVAHLRDQGGWDAVDDAYDDPPASSSEVIRPGEEREPVDIEIEDRSSDDWSQLEIADEPATETIGEAGMSSMFAAGIGDPAQPSVIGADEFIELTPEGETYHYDQPYTDGWAGDELVTYVPEELDDDAEPTDAAGDAGYVWQTEWTSETDAQQFVNGYLQLLEGYGAEPVTDRQDTYEIDDDYPGAYALEKDGETVTIVNAPTVEELDEIEPNAAPDGEDQLAIDDDVVDEESDADADEADDSIPGFGITVGVVSLLLATFAIRFRE